MRSLVCLLLALVVAAGPGEIGRPEVIPSFKVTGSIYLKSAADLTLYDMSAKPHALGELCDDKLTLIVSTSMSCPISRDNCPAVDAIARRYADSLQVLVVYTTEAHPKGAPSPYSDREWLTDRKLKDRILIDQPATLQARINRARDYRHRMEIESRLLVDNMENSLWQLIGGGPNCGLLFDAGEAVEQQGWLKPAQMDLAIQKRLNRARSRVARQAIPDANKYSTIMLGDDIGALRSAVATHPGLLRVLQSFDRSGSQQHSYLNLAISRDRLANARALIELGAPQLINHHGESPLHLAASKGLDDIAALLLERGADPTDVDDEGLTALHVALLGGHQSLARKLVDAGAFVDLDAAAGLGDLKKVQRFLTRYASEAAILTKRASQALSFAAACGELEAIELLLAIGADVNATANHQRPLYYAIQNGHSRSTEALLAAKAGTSFDIYHRGWSPHEPRLHRVVRTQKVDDLRRLLTTGLDVDLYDGEERTALHIAARDGHLEVARLLLDAGATINARTGSPVVPPCPPLFFDTDPLLETPLHFAARAGHIDMLGFLIDQGAKVNLEDRSHETALDAAKEHENAIALLKNAGGRPGKQPPPKPKPNADQVFGDGFDDFGDPPDDTDFASPDPEWVEKSGPPSLTLLDVREVWSQGAHNAFTSLLRWDGGWLLAFREGPYHGVPRVGETAGRIRVLRSADGESWHTLSVITAGANNDLRDPKFFKYHTMLYLTAASRPHGGGELQTLSWTSATGKKWLGPGRIGEADWWLWRVSQFDGDLFGVGYGPISSRPRTTRLYRAKRFENLEFEPWVSPFTADAETGETTLLRLRDDRAVALVRQDGAQKNARIGVSRGDFKNWHFSPTGVRVGGPDLLQLPDGRMIGAGRLYNPVRTALFWVDVNNRSLKELIALPSAGDCGYPGLAWHDDVLWVSYYSSQGDKSKIYLARLSAD